MFKVGDKVLVHQGRSMCSRLSNNQILKITDTYPHNAANLNCGHNGCGGVWFTELTLYKELITEVDFLNAFQENFKNGV